MALSPLTKLKERAETERAQLATGEAPKPRFESRLQATATRLLCAFFALMLLLTLFSRAADGVTVPRVGAEQTKTGVLTSRVTGSGTLEALGDLPLTLPGGIQVSGVVAEKGQRVAAGDVLLELDADDLAEQITALEEKLRILDLRLRAAASGALSDQTDAVLEAQRLLAEKEADLLRLQEKQTQTGARGTEDLTDATEALYRAQNEYDAAVEKAEKALIKTADEAIRAAEEQLKETEDSAADAIESAKAALESAEDAANAESDRQWSAVQAVSRAQEALNAARAELEALLADPAADPAAVQAAQEKVASAEAALASAQSALDGMGSSSSGSGTRRAKEALNRTKERWADKIKQAEEKLEEVRAEQEAKKRAMDVSGDPGVSAAKAAVESAEKAIKSQARANEDGSLTAQEQLLTAQRAVEEARRGVETAQRKVDEAARTDENTRRQAEIERLGYRSEQRVLQKTLDDLRAIQAAGGRLTAPIPGVVQSILEQPGKTQEGAQVVLLSRGDQGVAFTCKVPQAEAESLTPGDEGVLTFTHENKSQNVPVKISSVGAADEKGEVTVTADLPQGTYPMGVTARLEVSKRSEKYDITLPLGALRGEPNAYFVLVLRETRTVLGAELTVEKVPVRVTAQDSERMAITSDALQWDDRVVVSASKPVEEGDRVRLEEEKSE